MVFFIHVYTSIIAPRAVVGFIRMLSFPVVLVPVHVCVGCLRFMRNGRRRAATLTRFWMIALLFLIKNDFLVGALSPVPIFLFMATLETTMTTQNKKQQENQYPHSPITWENILDITARFQVAAEEWRGFAGRSATAFSERIAWFRELDKIRALSHLSKSERMSVMCMLAEADQIIGFMNSSIAKAEVMDTHLRAILAIYPPQFSDDEKDTRFVLVRCVREMASFDGGSPYLFIAPSGSRVRDVSEALVFSSVNAAYLAKSDCAFCDDYYVAAVGKLDEVAPREL